MSRLGEVLTDPTLDPPVRGDGRVELQPAGHRAQRRARPPGPGPRRPVHRRARAVPHRHGPLRRHRAAGHHPDRGDRRRAVVGPPVPGLERGRPSRPLGESCSNTELLRRLAAAMGFTEPALFDDDDDAARATRSAPKVDLDELRARRAGCACRTPRTGGRSATACSPRRRARSSWSASALVRMGQPALPTFVPPREGPPATPSCVARYPLQLLTPKQHTRFLNSGLLAAAQARPRRGRAVRRARRRRRRRPRAGRRRRRPRCSTTGPALQLPVRISDAAAPRRRRHPVRLVEAPAPRRQGGQLADQRHAHRMGRRRRLQRHAGRASRRRWADQRRRPSTYPYLRTMRRR